MLDGVWIRTIRYRLLSHAVHLFDSQSRNVGYAVTLMSREVEFHYHNNSVKQFDYTNCFTPSQYRLASNSQESHSCDPKLVLE